MNADLLCDPDTTHLTEFDVCKHCRGTDFYLDNVEWERTCMGCGVVGTYEFSVPVFYDVQRTYSKKSYFISGCVSKAVCAGAPLDRMDMELIERYFIMILNKFHATKATHRRKNFPNNPFILDKICKHMGIYITPFIKLPKLSATLAKLETDWVLINPF